MVKISGSYPNIVRGVSQQAASQRLEGQHAEQVNLISNPIIGLSRRRGTRYVTEHITGENPGTWGTGLRDYFKTFRVFDFRSNGNDYSLLYPTGPTDKDGVYMCAYNKTTKSTLPIKIDNTDNAARDMLSGGLNKVTQVGDFLIMACRGLKTTSTPPINTQDLSKHDAAVWVRAGTYNRTYRIICNIGTVVTAEFTTPTSAYPGKLDTSDIPYSDPDYVKKVNDRVNEYNSAVTQWLSTSATQTSPKYIANKLKDSLIAALGSGATVNVVLDNTIAIYHPNLVGIQVEDSMDNTSLRVNFLEVKSIDELIPVHKSGKVMRIKADDKTEAIYMRADVDSPVTGLWGKCVWKECAGESIKPEILFLIGVCSDDHVCVGSTPEALRGLVTGLQIPDYTGRLAGDSNTSPTPRFFGEEINYVGTFQDRLVVVSGSIINMSEVGNYFNFFRQSVLTVVDSDPVEAYALGAEDDAIHHSVIFDKSLLLFGENQQYTIDGRIPITPATTSIIQSSAHNDAVDAAPITKGALVFFGQRSEGLTKINQIVIGDVQETSMVVEITKQLHNYIRGVPVQLVGSTNPDMLFVRTTGDYSKLYVLRYLDQGRERVLESWFTWEYPKEFGDIIGLSMHDSQLLIYFNNIFETGNGVQHAIVVHQQSLLSETDSLPYLDGMIPYADIKSSFSNPVSCINGQPWLSCAVDNSHHAYLNGSDTAYNISGTGAFDSGFQSLLEDFPDLEVSSVWSGVKFNSYVETTSPFLRDSNGVAITTGRLTVTRMDVSYSNTAGFEAYVTTVLGTKKALDFNGRILGTNSATFDFPVASSSVPVFIGRESREYVLELRAKNWRPMTLTALEWTGQSFSSGKRQ